MSLQFSLAHCLLPCPFSHLHLSFFPTGAATKSKLRSRISFVLPVTERDRDDRSSSDGASTASPSPSPSPRKDADAAAPAVVRTTAAEFVRRYAQGRELGRPRHGECRRVAGAGQGGARGGRAAGGGHHVPHVGPRRCTREAGAELGRFGGGGCSLRRKKTGDWGRKERGGEEEEDRGNLVRMF
uniref:Uncharacterized protein n=1 Tax=Setaria viridis TaxID=4556 RepID=A0A4U6TX83_SETVI|nr:hypothetical protein SEVIR_7G317000v2 [Setaria viridis]